MIFYLGTHHTTWLKKTDVPLFVSRRRLPKKAFSFRPLGQWALDSGGFSELSMFGKWETTPEQYVNQVREFAPVGGLDFAAIQDWMCEPWIIEKTGLSIEEHQRRTVQSYFELNFLAPEMPWLPVLQGYAPEEYWNCVRLYEQIGVDLRALPRVGLGSVCRRQSTGGIAGLVRELYQYGLKLHGFGIKLTGIEDLAPYLASADSLAWSFQARRLQKPLVECVEEAQAKGVPCHKNCANCLRFALRWRQKVVDSISRSVAA